MLSCDLSLITVHISDYCQFSDIHISQGSLVTYLGCGEMFKYELVANLPASMSPKKIGSHLEKLWARVWCLVFLTHSVVKLSV